MVTLADANVRVTLDVNKFENDLRDKVTRAAQRAGKDFDRDMRKQLDQTGRNSANAFRDASRKVMARAGQDAGKDFEENFRQGVGKAASRAGQQIGRELRVSVGRAGVDAGRRFCDNMTKVLQGCGRAAGHKLAASLRDGMGESLKRGAEVERDLTAATSDSAKKAGQKAGKDYAVSFDIGIGSARIGRGVAAALAGITSQLITDVGPVGSLLAPIPGFMTAIVTTAIAVSAAFKGVGDAVKAIGTQEIAKIDEAMRNLSPQAQEMVREFRDVRGSLTGLRMAMQDAFFGQVRSQITQLVGVVAGSLGPGLVTVAESAGILAREMASAFTSPQGVENVNALLRGTDSLLDSMTPGLRNLTAGFLDFVGASAPALRDVGNALSDLFTRMGRFMSRAAESGDALLWVENALASMRRLSETVGNLVDIFQILLAAAKPLVFAMSELFGVVGGLANLFGSLPGPVQTLILTFALLRRTGAVEWLTSLRENMVGQDSVIRRMGGAFTDVSARASNWVATQGPLANMSTMLVEHSDRGAAALNRLSSGFGRVAGVAAGVGASVRTGLGALGSALGGPLGIGLGIAVAALGAYSQAEAEAEQRAAEHAAEVAKLADTLDRQTGAVTNATRATVADEAAKSGAIDQAKELGVSSELLVNALTGQEGALAAVQQRLADNARGAIESSSSYRMFKTDAENAGLTLDDLALAAAGNADAQKKLSDANIKAGGGFNQLQSDIANVNPQYAALLKQIYTTTTGLHDAQNATTDAAEAMTPAAIAAARYNDALAILQSGLSTAEEKAKALNEILEILAGGTTDAEVAQGNFTTMLQGLDDKLKDVSSSISGYGNALVANNGRINTSTTAGAMLIDTYDKLKTGLSTTAAATIEAGRQTGNLDQAYLQVAHQAQAARDQFVQTAMQLGLNETAANRLADSYGLIPAEVVSNVTDKGSAMQTQLQVIGVAQRLTNLPPNTNVRVTGLTEAAISALKETGVEVKRIPGSKDVIVNARTEDAQSKLSGLLGSLGNLVGKAWTFVVNGVGGKALGGIDDRRGVALMRSGGISLSGGSMPANRAEIVKPNTWRIIGDRAVGDEAFIPINKSARSISLLAETAKRMDFQLTPKNVRVESAGKSITVQSLQVNAPFADPELVARATVNEMARSAAS